MSLFYLIPSLPLLHFDAAPGITPAKFIETCREQLSSVDAEAVEALLCGRPSAHPFVVAWQDKETILRNAIARERARIAGKDVERWTRPTQGCDSLIGTEVEDAFQESDPLKREKALDKIRWLISDELQGPDPLTREVVFAYAIKLAVSTRWTALNADKGLELFNKLTQMPLSLSPEP